MTPPARRSLESRGQQPYLEVCTMCCTCTLISSHEVLDNQDAACSSVEGVVRSLQLGRVITCMITCMIMFLSVCLNNVAHVSTAGHEAARRCCRHSLNEEQHLMQDVKKACWLYGCCTSCRLRSSGCLRLVYVTCNKAVLAVIGSRSSSTVLLLLDPDTCRTGCHRCCMT